MMAAQWFIIGTKSHAIQVIITAQSSKVKRKFRINPESVVN